MPRVISACNSSNAYFAPTPHNYIACVILRRFLQRLRLNQWICFQNVVHTLIHLFECQNTSLSHTHIHPTIVIQIHTLEYVPQSIQLRSLQSTPHTTSTRFAYTNVCTKSRRLTYPSLSQSHTRNIVRTIYNRITHKQQQIHHLYQLPTRYLQSPPNKVLSFSTSQNTQANTKQTLSSHFQHDDRIQRNQINIITLTQTLLEFHYISDCCTEDLHLGSIRSLSHHQLSSHLIENHQQTSFPLPKKLTLNTHIPYTIHFFRFFILSLFNINSEPFIKTIETI